VPTTSKHGLFEDQAFFIFVNFQRSCGGK
jgi:hypothetical protein